jgi:hypothetical protein
VPAEDDVTHPFPRLQQALVLLALTPVALIPVACGGSQSGPDDPNSVESLLKTPPPAESSAPKADESGGGSGGKAAKDDDLNEAQKTQMEIALRRGGDKAANCASVVPGSAKGEGEVKVTFDGKKGRATDVSVGPPWAGTDAEGCIKRAFIGEIIVPFEGTLEVPYTVKVGKADDKGDKGKADKSKPKKK